MLSPRQRCYRLVPLRFMAATSFMSSIRAAAGLHHFPSTQDHLTGRRALVKASVGYVDRQAENETNLFWSRHACLQLYGPDERNEYVNRILDDGTPLSTLLLNAIVSGQFDNIFNRSTFNALHLPTSLPAVEGIYFVGAFRPSGKLLFGYVGKSKNIANRVAQHQKIITSPEEDPEHQQLFYRVARFAYQERLQMFFQPLITVPSDSYKFTTSILEPIFAVALGTYQKSEPWLIERANFNLPAVPYLGVNSTPCLET